MAQRKALVAGSLGIVGRNVAGHLQRAGGWDVVGIARSEPREPVPWRMAKVDLADTAACRRLIAAEQGITHLFYAARAPRPDGADEALLNVGMLRNLMQPLDEHATGFEHVCMVHGTKWYGSHLGPFRTPAREDDPRHLPPNFYFDQADYVEGLQKDGRGWTWSGVRPGVVCGFSLGYPHNLIAVLAVYAAILKHLRLPLRFPGTRACFEAVSQVTDVELLAEAMVWTATDPACANQHVNIVNGDQFRWCHLWERLARHFGMENGGVQTLSLSTLMADKGSVWQEIVRRHNLRPLALEEIVNWGYADMTFRQDWDHVSSTLKARRLGFQRFVETEEMFLAHLECFRTERVVP